MTKKNISSALFLCNCGTNISNFIDIDEVSKWAKEEKELKIVEIHDLLCSPNGKNFFKESLIKLKPENIIVAACSPKMHEKTFRDLAEEVGINIGKVHMANIREQCAWVTKDKKEATLKAKAIINAALSRAYYHENLEKRSIECLSDILIIGGGIAGIEAALCAANSGRKVYIVEKEISIGGHIIKTEELAPKMECSPCLLAPRLSEVKDHPNITVIANANINKIMGFFGNFKVQITQKATYVKDNCIGCEACFEVCPVSIDSQFHLNMGKKKAIHTLFPGSVPAAAAIDKNACKHFIDESCELCVKECPFDSIDFEDKDKEIELEIGAIVLATGFEPIDITELKNFGAGKIDNVYTLSQFERIASSNGPTGGKIILKNKKVPETIAVIHCAGSLNDDFLPYCSSICCTNAIKVGEYIRKQNKKAKVFNIHNDLVFPTPTDNNFYKKQLEEGTRFIKCKELSSIKLFRDKETSKVMLELPKVKPFAVDMVVLATGLKPSNSTKELAEMMHLELDEHGFFKPGHELISPTTTTIDGVYFAGCAKTPCNASTAVTRGHAAIGEATSKLVPGRMIELEIMTSSISEEKCAACKLCLTVCPYNAITFDPEKNVCIVNEAICRGCGTCTATCPSGASSAKHFTDEQIYAEIGGLFNE